MVQLSIPKLSLLGLLLAVCSALDTETDKTTYDYIVVGSGPGGGPLASRLARAGFNTLLLEAGDDQGSSLNYSIPGFVATVSEDEALAWNFYVNHYNDLAQNERDQKFSYRLQDGSVYVGLHPPSGATPLGVLYPRAGTVGGCGSHNQLFWFKPDDSDWEKIRATTSDSSWKASNMQQYFEKLENCAYSDLPGHGHDGWLGTDIVSPAALASDSKILKHLAGGATALGQGTLLLQEGLSTLLAGDPNSDLPGRDSTPGFFPVPLATKNGARSGPRDFIYDTIKAGFPLTVRTNTLVTRVIFDNSSGVPTAVGVEHLSGKYLYRASPRNTNAAGRVGKTYAAKEVILAGGVYNSPQLLKLSGIGPAAELKRFSIPLVVDLPGVGVNMQDRNEISVNVAHPDNFTLIQACTWDAQPSDPCFQAWKNHPNNATARGPYTSNGLAGVMITRSATADDTDNDLFIFGGPVDFTGYFDGWAKAVVPDSKHWSWYTLKAHTRNKAGTVQLVSADPRDTPNITFNYFHDAESSKDMAALIEGIRLARAALGNFSNLDAEIPTSSFVELLPGAGVTSDADLAAYIRDNTWGHHACCTNKIGADDDGLAVLDSQFRVRGVKGLRVVDASVFPDIPGSFISAAVYMVSEKAAASIIGGRSL